MHISKLKNIYNKILRRTKKNYFQNLYERFMKQQKILENKP